MALIRSHRPKIIFLCKIKATMQKIEEVANAVHMGNYFAIDVNGKWGRIAMLCRRDLNLTIIQRMDKIIHYSIGNPSFYFI